MPYTMHFFFCNISQTNKVNERSVVGNIKSVRWKTVADNEKKKGMYSQLSRSLENITLFAVSINLWTTEFGHLENYNNNNMEHLQLRAWYRLLYFISLSMLSWPSTTDALLAWLVAGTTSVSSLLTGGKGCSGKAKRLLCLTVLFQWLSCSLSDGSNHVSHRASKCYKIKRKQKNVVN